MPDVFRPLRLRTALPTLHHSTRDRDHRINTLNETDRRTSSTRPVLLLKGGFVDQGVNDLAFGLPGASKSHTLCAVGHRLVESGRSVPFAPAYRLVQGLLAAKRDIVLPRQLRKLDNSDFLALDDLGYLPQGAEESEVLVTLIVDATNGVLWASRQTWSSLSGCRVNWIIQPNRNAPRAAPDSGHQAGALLTFNSIAARKTHQRGLDLHRPQSIPDWTRRPS